MNDAASPPIPIWEQLYPGRFKAEIDALRAAGTIPEVDSEKLAQGQLSLHFDWTLTNGKRIHLVADYPDAFPHCRPHVFLQSGLDPAPKRHLDPIGGNICLLGRDSRQWKPSYTLANLLSLQLEDALTEGGDEDTQGEPSEFWWNGLGLSESYVLIDSSFQFHDFRSGRLLLRYIADDVPDESLDGQKQRGPRIRAYVAQIQADDGTSLGTANGPLPNALQSANRSAWIPWIRTEKEFLPSPPIGAQIRDLLKTHRHLKQHRTQIRCTKKLVVEPYCVISPSELSFGHYGDGWAFPVVYGTPKELDRKNINQRGPKKAQVGTLPVYRAGLTDITYRASTSRHLRSKHILLVGCGAIGAPLAIELARNGVASLQLVDHDAIKPGNTVRWPLGTSSWGRAKVDCLRDFITLEYPSTDVHGYQHAIGGHTSPLRPGDDAILSDATNHVDLIIDASTNHGVTTYLHRWAERKGLPMISFFATPSIEGGVVAAFSPGGACPNCLEWAWETGDIEPPKGWQNEERLIQPPGCSELTFDGASYELTELSLQATRLAVAMLDSSYEGTSVVHTLSLIDSTGGRCAPRWLSSALDKHRDCPCRSK